MHMAVLWNKLDKQQALKKLSQEDFRRKTVSFYRYVMISDPKSLRNELYKQWEALGVMGRIYVACEGINAQISVPEPKWDNFVTQLYAHAEFEGVPFKHAIEDDTSFWKLAIKVRKQIVADGLTQNDYDVTNVGKHLSPAEFNAALEDENTLVVDMRNHYESRVGRFEKALTPDADTFREELPMVKEMLKGKEDKKILLYCTGGIRCEKASAYLKHQGFKDVNQLHGGIIQYAHEIAEKRLLSRFLGKNFVFDERLGERVTSDILSHCDQCGDACDDYDNCKNKMCNLLFIQCKGCQQQWSGCCSEECKKIAELPESEQRRLRAGIPHTFTRYKKQIRPKEALPIS